MVGPSNGDVAAAAPVIVKLAATARILRRFARFAALPLFARSRSRPAWATTAVRKRTPAGGARPSATYEAPVRVLSASTMIALLKKKEITPCTVTRQRRSRVSTLTSEAAKLVPTV